MQCQKLKTNLETGRVIFLPLRLIRPNPSQPRQVFDRTALEELSASIAHYGVLQPISVRRTATGYELIAGERRLRAAAQAGLTEIPCLVMQMDDRDCQMAAMVENLQRQDLDFVEEARGLKRMMELWGLSQEQTAKAVGKSQSAVANKLRLLRHSSRVLDALRQAGLTERHARALLKLDSEEDKLSLIQRIAQEDLSVAGTELLIDRLQRPVKPSAGKCAEDIVQDIARRLQKIKAAGTTVTSERRETADSIMLTITIAKEMAEISKEL